jgi:F-box and leucine-rich repeat protein 1 (S-phase kinase-associated protein 2)
LKAAAMQALCDAFSSLHTCPNQRSLNVSGCLALTNVHCHCGQKRA